ncbi:MAG: NADH-quinone oxidoreductase subunit NuoF [Spirochaetales bacterium]|nr:NADH-quinone oxidoreductase subunit NuoF [Spirochaetales bacterium]
MNKIKNLEDLKRIKEENLPRMIMRGDKNAAGDKKHILVCGGTGCQSSKSKDILNNLKKAVTDNNLQDRVEVIMVGCFGFCEQGPIVEIEPDDVFYVGVQPSDAEDIIKEHIINGNKIERLLYTNPANGEKITTQHDIPFYKKQMRIALQNCGRIDPENINEYIAVDGYAALAKVLTEMGRDNTLEELKKSGLRGRGGGGFPIGKKLEFAKMQNNPQKYIICNADEGDPGAFMDRSILEGDPNSVLEAMAIAGYIIGANEGRIYIRAEYPLAIDRLRVAIKQAEDYGLLGDNILGTGFNFRIFLCYGAGAFVCGEETALIHSIEGNRGEPSVKPPFPAVSGLWKKPTTVNNVETFANVPKIILKGADWFCKLGTEKSHGTKVFALAGKINNVGLVEVPMGITLREIIYDVGGGIKNGKKFKAVQTGGPSGGCISADNLDIQIDYDNLISIGSMMGSGGMIVLDEDNCMVNVAKFYLEFTKEESCGRCTPCRVGNKRLLEILEKITDGKGTMEDLDKLKELAESIKDTALCGLGQTAPNPVLSTLKCFYDEYLAHVQEKRCPAGNCAKLKRYTINADKCKGCSACSRVCPVKAISGEIKKPFVINQDKCIKCGTCLSTCKFGAIEVK